MKARIALFAALAFSFVTVRAAEKTSTPSKSPTTTKLANSTTPATTSKAVTPTQPVTMINYTLTENGKFAPGGRIYGTGTEDVIFTVVGRLLGAKDTPAGSPCMVYLYHDGLKGEFMNTNASAFNDPKTLVRNGQFLCYAREQGRTINLGKIRGDIFIGIVTPQMQSVTQAIYKIGPKERNPDNTIHAAVRATAGRLRGAYWELKDKHPAGVPVQTAILVGFEEMSSAPEGSGTAHWKSDNDLDDVILAFTSGITTPDSTVKMTDVSVPAPTPRTVRK